MKKLVPLLIAALLSVQAVSPAARAAITAGCARVNITPPVGVWLSGYGARNKPSDDIEDELFAKALVLSDGAATVALVGTDLLWVPIALTHEIRAIVAEKTGIPAQNVLVCASHTHFGPKVYSETALGPDDADNSVDEAYVRTLVKKIGNCVFLAHRDMQEARIGAARGEVTEVVYNRRPRRADGSVTTTFHLPPEIVATRKIVRGDDATRVTFTYPAGQEQPTFGPIDPAVWVLRVETAEGDLLASVVNYACHAVSGSTYPDWFYSISAEYPGEMMRVVEKIEGGLCLFTSGTAGDIVPLKRGKEPRFWIGRTLAGEVVKRLQFVPTRDEAALAAKKTQIELPLKEDLPPDAILNANEDRTSLTTEIQVLRIGDVTLLGLPGEILVEVGLEIKKRAPVDKLLIIALANDSIGYVCHRAAYEEGGYESDRGANLAPGAAEMMIEQALKLLQQMKEETTQTASL